MQLNKYGKIVRECWVEIPRHFPNVSLDQSIIMPNHFHGIVTINDYVGAQHAAPLHERGIISRIKPGGIPAIVRSFKSAVTKNIRALSQMPTRIVWQRNYYEHVIRADKLDRVREYIQNNPAQWNLDKYYSDKTVI